VGEPDLSFACYTDGVFERRSLPEITLAELSDDAVLIDVREGDEWAAGHAPAAHHVPMMEIPGRIDEVPRERDVVVVCRVGARSAQVVAYLLNQGYERVANLDGGMIAWEAAGRPLVSEVRSTAIVL
jgi:rhodanese-related sulfurtransferase